MEGDGGEAGDGSNVGHSDQLSNPSDYISK
jgi:hypothetical protein